MLTNLLLSGTKHLEFGRYISYIGPQTTFPVPEGILNYRGNNTIGILLWALNAGGAHISSLDLWARTPVATSRFPVSVVQAPGWAPRKGAY